MISIQREGFHTDFWTCHTLRAGQKGQTHMTNKRKSGVHVIHHKHIKLSRPASVDAHGLHRLPAQRGACLSPCLLLSRLACSLSISP